MSQQKLADKSNEELLEIIRKLKKQKKYGLVWEEKPEEVVERCKKELPVLEEVKDKAILKDPDGPTNLLIEGDNYHALSVLNYTHAGKIDVIYIDPPYNTGNKDFKYNDKYVDVDDAYRHSKWLSFMEKRLFLANTLLSKDGVLFISIDDNEIAQLRILMDTIMPSCFVTTIHVQMSTVSGQKVRAAKNGNLVKNGEYVLVYSKARTKSIGRKILWDPVEYDNHYSIFLTPNENDTYSESSLSSEIAKNNDLMQLLKIVSLTSSRNGKQIFPLKNIKKAYERLPQFRDYIHDNADKIVRTDRMVEIPDNDKEKNLKQNTTYRYIHPSGKNYLYGIDSKGELKQRFLLSEKLQKADDYYRTRGICTMRGDWWAGFHLDMGNVPKEGGVLLLNGKKPVRLVKQLLAYVGKTDDVILDFFAGSGTTGQAVLELNNEDGGRRQYILATNNENNICKEVCYPRLHNVHNGLNRQKKLGGNLKYFKTSFVFKHNVTDDVKRELVARSTEMICVKEGTFDEVKNSKANKIFRNNKQITGILFDLDALTKFKKEVANSGLPVHIYVFSLTSDTYDEDFEDLGIEHELCPIPESILEVYRKLFK